MILAPVIVGYLIVGLCLSWSYYRHRWNKIRLKKTYRHPSVWKLGHADSCGCRSTGRDSRGYERINWVSAETQWKNHLDATEIKAFVVLLTWPIWLFFWASVTLAMGPAFLFSKAFKGLNRFWHLGITEEPAKAKIAA